MNDMDMRKNAEGYTDPTAYGAWKNISEQELIDYRRFRTLLSTIFRICDLSDFYIEERMVIRDKRTGKIWR